MEDVVIVAAWYQENVQIQRRDESWFGSIRATGSILYILFRLVASSSTESLTIARKLSDWLQSGKISTDLQARGWQVVVGSSGYPLVVRSSDGNVIATFPLSSAVWEPQPSRLLLLAFVIIGLTYRSAIRRRKSMQQNQASLEQTRRTLRAVLDLQRVYRGHLHRVKVKRMQRGEDQVALEDLFLSHSEGLEAPAAIQQSDEDLYDLSKNLAKLADSDKQPSSRAALSPDVPPPPPSSKKPPNLPRRNPSRATNSGSSASSER
ncbi:hypothetical protein GUITHDRAFT_109300 [Guillardia theta CCMP2712]|uniref:Uncharacterized protein n=1 Tax=Guillardia theta (strain CCMP2712) TaxID=905079 RepID=L1J9W6_GUITC|nr:hypothetical protein GUITHDRAFT_109300 [Guillardia theta CCMP2712]EKX44880.1 hypothetical protein GUITHDRAFT_109300 [Guillardia theta CCMP2712]|eukprot:XP_005831860.1 hypothetical protein GUITHDRAFT_109300 [Guillardia theta CCMP2712]